MVYLCYKEHLLREFHFSTQYIIFLFFFFNLAVLCTLVYIVHCMWIWTFHALNKIEIKLFVLFA